MLRFTEDVTRVLTEFVNDPDQPRYGYDLVQATGVDRGRLYAMLKRLEKAGVIEPEPEPANDPPTLGTPTNGKAGGWPARRLLRLTPAGLALARFEVAAARQEQNPDSDVITT